MAPACFNRFLEAFAGWGDAFGGVNKETAEEGDDVGIHKDIANGEHHLPVEGQGFYSCLFRGTPSFGLLSPQRPNHNSDKIRFVD